ncbi:hypothetical protein PPERSA_10934 [Pseudocohnilembus persalinus]|uniref:Tetratricopeptide repeat protein n=1 Tax=Pseudocohnilembus persalinus TaxID=266149 RepID=A0A0V0R9K2_PSEPJ|nr:hypothetical protein PPERSA_10934 [Pseudocohnilembus persalinus]|eukprot:KRX11167.1 hypothetical protein PPERSA_10934 [Pseudocohnilembus persalinus]
MQQAIEFYYQYVPKQRDIAKIDSIYANYSKQDELDPLQKEKKSLIHEVMNQNPKYIEEQLKIKFQNKEKMTRIKFKFLLFYTAQQRYLGTKNPMDKFLLQLFIEAHQLKKQGKIVPKFLQMDELNKKVLTDVCFQCLFEHQKDFENAFTMLQWDEIQMLNESMNPFALVNLLHDQNILGNKITIEFLQDCISKVIPPPSSRASVFYQSNKILQIYNDDFKKRPVTTSYQSEPQIYFHDFQFIFARIALELSDSNNLKKDMYKEISQIFEQIIGFRNNNQVQQDIKNKTEEQYFDKLGNSYGTNMAKQFSQKSYKKQLSIDDKDNEVDSDPSKILEQQLANQRLFAQQQPKYDAVAIAGFLEDLIPSVPEKYQQEKEYSVENFKFGPERFKDYKVIGVQPPKPPPNKNQAAKAKNQKKEKKDKDARPVVWAEMPKPPAKTNYEYIEEFKRKQEFDTVNLSDLAKGVMSNVQVKPVQLDEIIYPCECPEQVQKYVEAAILSYTEQDFSMAQVYVQQGIEEWLKLEDVEIEYTQELFFEYFKGQIFQSAGRNDLALSQYYICKLLSDKIPVTDPNKSLPYSGMGAIFFRLEEFELSLRCYLQALQMREAAIGSDNPEVALVYNNLGCCMQMLERNMEASTYFELAEAIFDLEFGPFHIKTQTAKRNFEKSKKYLINYIPEFRKPWVAYYSDPTQKLPEKPKKKK